MRTYIFTERERRLIYAYLRGEENREAKKLIYKVRVYRNSLLSDVKLLLKLLRRCEA